MKATLTHRIRSLFSTFALGFLMLGIASCGGGGSLALPHSSTPYSTTVCRAGLLLINSRSTASPDPLNLCADV